MRSIVLALALFVPFNAPALAQEPAELVLVNGRIVTLSEEQPEVRALAARDGEIVALGEDAEVRALAGEGTRVIDLEGRLAIPGFIEGHGHFLGIGDMAMQLDLTAVGSWDEVVALVAAAAREAQPRELIRGRGWHQEKWVRRPERTIEGLPTHHGLSRVSPVNPVLLVHASGHATFANQKAMEVCGITRETTDPPGGEIVRDEAGEPIGVFREAAAGLLGKASMGGRAPSRRRLAELAVDEVLANGITSFQDAGSSIEDTRLFRAMADDGSLRCRLWVMLRETPERLRAHLDDARVIGYGDEHLTVRGIKHSIDGALGSHGAWLLEEYADLPGSTGLNVAPVPMIEECARVALEHEMQLCVHAIGDRANRETLDLFERAFAGLPEDHDLRWRVEHAQHLSPDDIPRFAALGVIASMQGVHCTSDGPWVVPRLGEERARTGAYVWRSLLDSGAVVTNGTDAPVEDVSPIASFHATVSRKLKDGSRFFPEQRMTRLEALESYTRSNAFAAFEEDRKGALAVGMLADVTVLSKDILTVPEDEILQAEVLYTIVGGRVEHEARAR